MCSKFEVLEIVSVSVLNEVDKAKTMNNVKDYAGDLLVGIVVGTHPWPCSCQISATELQFESDASHLAASK